MPATASLLNAAKMLASAFLPGHENRETFVSDGDFFLVGWREVEEGHRDVIELPLMASPTLDDHTVTLNRSARPSPDSGVQLQADLQIRERGEVTIRFEAHPVRGYVKRPIQDIDFLVSAEQHYRTERSCSGFAR